MFGIGVPELLLILVIGLVVFGPGKLPEIGRSLGKTINEFKKVTSSITLDQPAAKPKPAQPAQQTVAQPTAAATAETKPADGVVTSAASENKA